MTRPSCKEVCKIVADSSKNDIVVITMSTMKVFPTIAPDAYFVSSVPLMGGAGSIGMGIAIARPDKQIWVLDGDASLLMELGSLVTIAEAAPQNFVHILFNNQVQYGGTANLDLPGGGRVDFSSMAVSACYPIARKIKSSHELLEFISSLKSIKGPIFLDVDVEPDASYYDENTPQKEIFDHQLHRMGEEARRVKEILTNIPLSD